MKVLEDNFLKIFIDKFLHRNFYVSYSGGIDSSILLYFLYQNFNKNFFLKIIHINHSYNKYSFFWAKFSRIICDDYSFLLYTYTIKNKTFYSNLEGSFRLFRYNSFFKIVLKNSSFLLGHHYNDLLETFFLRVIRGSGLLGLSGIKCVNKIYKINLFRPFLFYEKKELLIYKFFNNVFFVNDFSNFDVKFFRNFIRYKFLYKLLVLLKKNIFFRFLNILNQNLFFINIFCLFLIRSYYFKFLCFSLKFLKKIPFYLISEFFRSWFNFYGLKFFNAKHFVCIYKLIHSEKLSFMFFSNIYIIKLKNFVYLEVFFKPRKKNLFFVYINNFNSFDIIFYTTNKFNNKNFY